VWAQLVLDFAGQAQIALTQGAIPVLGIFA
jgi:hypothetical protein